MRQLAGAIPRLEIDDEKRPNPDVQGAIVMYSAP